MSIVIKFKESLGKILINDSCQEIVNHQLNLDINDWTLIKIKSPDSTSYQIDDILIENVSIAHLKFIIFNSKTKECNFGWIGHDDQVIPLHPNYAVFRRTVLEFIDQGDYGMPDLYKKYDFGFNSNPTLKHEFPKQVHDFFNDKIGPTWHKRWHKASPWFIGVEIDRTHLFNEAMANRHLLSNRKIQADSYLGWEDTLLKIDSLVKLHNIGFKYFAEILDACRFRSLESINLGFLPPGGYIDSHKDIKSGEMPLQKVYIPVLMEPGNYFKFYPGGYAPLELPNAMCLNTDEYLHAAINDSDSNRYILAVKGHAEWH